MHQLKHQLKRLMQLITECERFFSGVDQNFIDFREYRLRIGSAPQSLQNKQNELCILYATAKIALATILIEKIHKFSQSHGLAV